MNRGSEQHPAIFIILGATGDLAMRKLFPALQELVAKNMLGKVKIVSYARRPFTDEEFRDLVKKEAEISDENFLKLIHYVQGTFDSKEGYQGLGHELGRIDQEFGVCSHKLFHLSISPVFYEIVLKQMDEAGLSLSCVQGDGVTRLLMEKPVGFNRTSAERVIEETERIFLPHQIHRVDHYLMKDHLYTLLTEKNLGQDKSTNAQVIIELLEKIDIQGRGTFYDSVGALRDVAQNHALEMLALVNAENPHNPKSRAEFLRTCSIEEVITGQYEGYTNEEGVNKDSRTETYFSIKGQSARGSFCIRGGKALGESAIKVTISGNSFNLKQPGGELGAYARMYIDAYNGNSERFVSREEILESWRIIDEARIISHTKELFIYPKGWTPTA